MGTQKHSQETMSPEEHREKLHNIVKDARTVMLLSHGDGEKIIGRPMALARTDDDTTMYLVTAIDSKKVDEIRRESRVSVSVQAHDGWAMIDGDCRVSQDRKLIDELWEDAWKPWLEGGKADPAIAILVITPNEGTYWASGFAHGLSYLYRMVKARVTGDEMEIKPGDQGKVKLAKH
jgi:general stress protein 26